MGKKLRQIARNADLDQPEKVLEYIGSLNSPNTKNLLATVYQHYCSFHGIRYEKPRYSLIDSATHVPLEENLDYIIKTARSLKRKVAFGILKDTGIRPIELSRLTLGDIDLEQGILYIKSAKQGIARNLKLKSETLANLKQLVARIKPSLTERLFCISEVLSELWREERLRAYAETGNAELLKIRLYDLRHFYATRLYHNTKDIFRVKNDLGHRSIQNTLRYCHVAEFKDDEYTVRTAKTIQEAAALLEVGFDYVTEFEDIKIFRKRK
jgi:integrase/recombinase XerD